MILSIPSAYSDGLFPMPHLRLSTLVRAVLVTVTVASGSLVTEGHARQESLTSIKVQALEVAPAPSAPELAIGEQKVAADAGLSAAKLAGLPESVKPLAGAMQSNAAWVVAADAAGVPQLWRHDATSGWTVRAAPPLVPLPGAARASGQAHLLVLAAGTDGTVEMLSYQTITNAWARLGVVPVTGAIADVRLHDNGFAVRTAASGGYTSITIESSKRLLKALDWIVIVLYLALSAGVGLFFYLREKKNSNTDYFLAGRNVPWWAAGISLYATGTSAISFIAIPAKSFATNWHLLAQNVVALFATAVVAMLIIPLIRRLNVMSVYHYLEMRFHPSIRTVSSGINIVLQLGGRMSIVLFLPSLALAAVTGISVTWSILLMGLVTIVYTLLGGMKAVIWTDVLQVVVMLGGAFFAIGYVIWHVDGGASGFFAVAQAEHKMDVFNWAFDIRQPTIWGFLFFAVVDVITYPKDQVMMQRVLATKNPKEAGWSVWTLAAIVVPGSLTFFGIGTALYVYYQQHPEKMNPLLNVDATFPHFIAAELPVGITGLIIAGIFAASMSTLSSCMNSVATLISVDFYEKFAKNPTQEKSVRLAEWMTVVAGVIGVGTALILAQIDIQSALDKSWELLGLLGGGFAGCYGLGMFTRRANWQGAIIGVIGSLIITFACWRVGLVNAVFYQPLSIGGCILVGYLASYLFPAPQQSLLGLTVFDRKKSS